MQTRLPKPFVVRQVAIPLLGILMCSQLILAESAPNIGPTISIDSRTLEFNEISPTDAPMKSIQITNSGNEDLKIKKTASTCFCTVVEDSALTVPPGESTEIPVTLSLAEYTSNTVRSFVTIESNAVNEPIARVEVTGTVIPELLIEPAQFDFGTVKRGTSLTKAVVIRPNGIDELEITEVKASDGLATAFREVEGGYAVVVLLNPGDNDTRIDGAITVVTNVARIPEVQIPVRADVVGVECTITPKVLVFDAISPGAIAGAVEIEGKYDLEIVEASFTDNSFTCTVDTIDEAKRYRVTVRAADNAKDGDIFGTLNLSVKEGELVETRKVTVFGTIE